MMRREFANKGKTIFARNMLTLTRTRLLLVLRMMMSDRPTLARIAPLRRALAASIRRQRSRPASAGFHAARRC